MKNPPAFPRPYSEDAFLEETDYLAQDGMTLRDYFAAQIAVGAMSEYWNSDRMRDPTAEDIAQTAYAIADAMLKAREA